VKKFQREEEAEQAAKTTLQRPKRAQKGLSYNEQRELELLTQEIESLETRISELEDSLNSPSEQLSHLDYARISADLQNLSEHHQAKLQRWLELDDKAGN
jgi:molecular chaperone GrpE (heat shock protein)